MKQRLSLNVETLILLLFAALPVVDSVNGILIDKGLPSVGPIYKILLLGVLAILVLRSGELTPGLWVTAICSVAYILFSVAVNVLLLDGTLPSLDFPVKLSFNVLQLVLLLSCHRAGYLTGRTLDRIFHISTWLMCALLLIPYVLGLGNAIYKGGIGYKGFFFSNNELSVVLLILFYYSLYRATVTFSALNVIQLGGIAVCVLLLNTKSGMIACALGVALFLVEYLRKPGAPFKGLLVATIAIGLVVAKDFIMEQVASFMERQMYLHRLYGGSVLETLVSGRFGLLEKAWKGFMSHPGWVVQLIIGNGFCAKTLVEMDFVDLFFYLGIFGSLAAAIALVVIFVKSLPNFRKDGTWMRPFGYLLVAGFSFLAGHTLFMATSGCYFVLMLCYDLLYVRESQETKLPS